MFNLQVKELLLDTRYTVPPLLGGESVKLPAKILRASLLILLLGVFCVLGG